ncbi:octopamine receptor beta-1r [Plakobranchus ocellatus]|uniref:Octopamine receptor beta-1r n=1 Tax=Plakobranchus ocellatus TaxID=259542 RepID=A0AAV3YJC1_9GAST|nr:octopamine receptor beta-1r [Plakobranchus ocellatus]
MEGNDVEISIDLDVSHLVLDSVFNLENVFHLQQTWKSKHQQESSEGMDTTTAVNSNFGTNRLFSALDTHMANRDKISSENEKETHPLSHLPVNTKSINSLALLPEIKEMQVNDHYSYPKMSSSSISKPHSPRSELLSSTLSTKGVPDFFLDNSHQAIDTELDAEHPMLHTSNSSMFLTSGGTEATGMRNEDWNLSMASILNSQSADQTQSFLSSVTAGGTWSGEEIGAVCIITLMVPFILCSNLLVILSIVRFRRLHIPTNYFVTSLASVDVLVAVATPFMIMVEVFQFGAPVQGKGYAEASGALLCLLPNRILMMACGVSLLTLATIAYDRHTALVSPLDYVVIMTSRRVTVLVSLTWAYTALIVWLPLLAGWHDEPTEVLQCSADLLHGKAQALFLSAIFLPSCAIILVCYARIFSLAHHHAQAIAAVEFAVHRRLQVKFMVKDTKYAKTLALVIGVFLALWLPYLVSVFVKLVAGVTLDIWLQTYLVLLAVLNSGINPWIYAFKNKEFRHAFRRLYHEFFRERVCLRRFGRRISFAHTSGSSSTPRLSRTDSRMATAVIDSATLDNVCEKLQRSLDSLDRYDKFCDRRLEGQYRPWRSGPLPESHRVLSVMKKSLRDHHQAASCSDLHDGSLDEMAAILPRSLSMELISKSYVEGSPVNISELEQRVDACKDSIIHADAQFSEEGNERAKSSLVTDQYNSSDRDTSLMTLPFFSSPSSSELTSTSLTSASSTNSFSNPAERLLSREANSADVCDIHDNARLQSTFPKHFISNNVACKKNSLKFVDTMSYISELPSSLITTDSNIPLRTDSPTILLSPSYAVERVITQSSRFTDSEEQTVRQFTSMNGCRDFYPESRSLSCTVELRVP